MKLIIRHCVLPTIAFAVLAPKDAAAFWPIYQQYESELTVKS